MGSFTPWENTFMTCKDINFLTKTTYTGDSPLAAVVQLLADSKILVLLARLVES